MTEHGYFMLPPEAVGLNVRQLSLRPGQFIDVRDHVGKWIGAKILKVDSDASDTHPKRVFVHYIDWDSKWDEWIDVRSQSFRVSEFGRFSSGEPDAHTFRMHQWVRCYHLKNKPNQWTAGYVRNIDGNQIQIEYQLNEKIYHYWYHVHTNEVTVFEQNDGPGYQPVAIQQWMLTKELEVKDQRGRWLPASVKEVRPGMILVHYRGWADRWNEWLSLASPTHLERIRRNYQRSPQPDVQEVSSSVASKTKLTSNSSPASHVHIPNTNKKLGKSPAQRLHAPHEYMQGQMHQAPHHQHQQAPGQQHHPHHHHQQQHHSSHQQQFQHQQQQHKMSLSNSTAPSVPPCSAGTVQQRNRGRSKSSGSACSRVRRRSSLPLQTLPGQPTYMMNGHILAGNTTMANSTHPALLQQQQQLYNQQHIPQFMRSQQQPQQMGQYHPPTYHTSPVVAMQHQPKLARVVGGGPQQSTSFHSQQIQPHQQLQALQQQHLSSQQQQASPRLARPHSFHSSQGNTVLHPALPNFLRMDVSTASATTSSYSKSNSVKSGTSVNGAPNLDVMFGASPPSYLPQFLATSGPLELRQAEQQGAQSQNAHATAARQGASSNSPRRLSASASASASQRQYRLRSSLQLSLRFSFPDAPGPCSSNTPLLNIGSLICSSNLNPACDDEPGMTGRELIIHDDILYVEENTRDSPNLVDETESRSPLAVVAAPVNATSPEPVRSASSSTSSLAVVCDLKELFEHLGIASKYLATFEEEEIEVEDLVVLNEEDLKSLLPKLGPRRRLQNYIEAVKAEAGLTIKKKPVSASSSASQPPLANTGPVSKSDSVLVASSLEGQSC